MLSVHLVSLLTLVGTLAHAGPIHIPSKYTKRSGACRATNGTLQAQVGAAWAGVQSSGGVATGGTQPTGGQRGWGGHHGWSHVTGGGGAESAMTFQGGHMPTGDQTGGSWGPSETESEGVKQTGGGAGTAAMPTVTETMTSAAGPSQTPVSASDTTTPAPPAVSTSPSPGPGTIPTTTTSSSSTAPSGSSSDEDTLLTLHNDFRAEYGASSLTWDSTLASYAQSYASKCVFEHSGGPYGENLAAGGGGGYDVTAAFNSWANEAADYNWGSPGFSESTGHFTQVVWKATTKLGCAYVTCDADTVISGWNSDAGYLVCEYSPAGNVVNDGEFAANVGEKVS